MSKRNSLVLVLLTAAALGVAGCGDSPQHRMQRARIALTNNQPEMALKLVDKVLDGDPQNAQALLLKAETQMALTQLEGARVTLEQLINLKPDDAEARRQRINWVSLSMEDLLKQSAFASNDALQARFGRVSQVGLAEVEWLKSHAEKSEVEVSFTLAVFADKDVRRLQALIAAKKNTLAGNTDLPGEIVDQTNNLIKQLEQERDARIADEQHDLLTTLELEPRHAAALVRYAQLLTQQKDWPAVWAVAQRLAGEKTLPANGVGEVILALLAMPNAAHDLPARLETGRQLLEAVDPALREAPVWKISSARLYLNKGDAASARPLLEQAQKKDPNDPQARYLLAHVLVIQKEYAKAKAILEALPNNLQNNPDVLTVKGLALLGLKDYPLAEEALRQAIKMAPDNALARQALVEVMNAQGRMNEAESDVKELYDRNPANPLAIRVMVQFLVARGLTAELADVLKRTERIDPLTVDHLAVLADGYRLLPNPEKFLHYARELVQQKPDEVGYQLSLADALAAAGQEEEARKLLTDLHKKYPGVSSVDLLLGQRYLHVRNYDRAIAILQGAVTAEPNNVDARLSLATAYSALSLTNEALEQVNAVLDRNPMDARAHALASDLYRLLGDEEKMTDHLWKIDPAQIPENRYPVALARLKVRQGDLDEAVNICNRAVAAGSNDPFMHLLLAEIYRRKKQPRPAEDNILTAIRLQPQNLLIYLVLARFYFEQNDLPKGIVQLTNLESLNPILARIAHASLLDAAGKIDEGSDQLQPLVAPLIQQRNRLVLAVVETLARNHQLQNKTAAAIADYDPLIAADFMAHEAELRQIDLTPRTLESLDGIARRLDALAGKLSPEEDRTRADVINRLIVLGHSDRALSIMDQWIASRPNQPDLLRLKGNMLLGTGRGPEAVKVFQDLAARAPENMTVRLSLAQAYMTVPDFPRAERVFEDMAAQTDAGAQMFGLAQLGRMFLALGLNHQAAAAFDRLERVGRPRDPRLLYAMGQALAKLGKDEQARERLKAVPPYAPQYAAAQVLLAQLEQRDGLTDDARKRLQELVRQPRTAPAAALELVKLNLRQQNTAPLLEWCDQVLALDSLTGPYRQDWLINLRIPLCDQRRDWNGVLSGLEDFSRLRPDSLQALAARVAVLIQLQRLDQARQLFVANPKLADGAVGPLLAVVLGEPPADIKDYPPLPAFVAALARGDLDSARAAAKRLPSLPTIFPSDLLAVLDRPDVRSRDMESAVRLMALALASSELGLRQMTGDVCQEVIELMPSLSLAHALQLDALRNLGQPVEPVLGRVEKSAARSNLGKLVAALKKERAGDPGGAADAYAQLMDAEPANFFVRQSWVGALQKAGRFDQAIAVLEKAYAAAPPDRILLANSLAYLLAEHQPRRLDEAQKIAQTALDQTRFMPALLDTAGWIAHLRGDDAQALSYLGKAIVGLTTEPVVHYHLGVVYNQLHNLAWARYHLTEAAAGPQDVPEVIKAKALLDSLPKG